MMYAKADFSRAASTYQRVHHLQADTTHALSTALIPHLPQRKHIMVDAGCGTGALSRFFKTRTVVQCDISDAMCGQAAQHNPHTLCADITAMPLRNNSIDVYYSSLCWQWTQPNATIAEMHRILSKPGLLALALLTKGTCETLNTLYRQCDIALPSPYYPSHEDIITQLGNITLLHCEHSTHAQHYSNGRDVLRYFQKLGAIVSSRPLGSSATRRLCRTIDAQGGITLDYHISLLIGRYE